MSNSFPCVSVVMPVYNSEKYLREAIESILAQTFQNFELIVVDDGSTDSSASILAGYCQQDERIVILTHLMNQGIAMALNRGLKIAQGNYIARMDADDFSLPERFERQVDFLETHPDVGILGCEAIFMDSKGQDVVRLRHPRDDLSLRWMGLIANVFFHPTVMIRRAVLTDFNLEYQTDSQPVEDYNLWLRILEHSQGANLDQPLVRYRVYPESISSQHKLEGMAKHAQTSYAYVRRMYPEIQFTLDEHAALVAAVTGKMSPSQYRQRPALMRHYLELWRTFMVQHRGNPDMKRLRHETVLQAAKIGLYPPFMPGWLETLRSLFAADPLWMMYFAGNFPRMVKLKLSGWHLHELRAESKKSRG